MKEISLSFIRSSSRSQKAKDVTMEKYSLLEQTDEDALHKSRLLNVEEKPFKRITKRLFAPKSLISSPASLLPTPPPDAASENADAVNEYEADKQRLLEDWRQLREDVTLDFATFESSITRIHFLQLSNEKERERYAAEKLEILSTAREVKENTAELRIQLEEAQKTLALRKTYDELADKITSNRLLRPRDDQQANLEKLHAEIAKLENESSEYAQTWAERREQFGRIVEEGLNLRRLIRDEKEEVERREGMEEGDGGDEGDAISKGKRSTAGTPRSDPESVATSQQPGLEETNPAISKIQQEKSRTLSPLRQTMTASATSKETYSHQEVGDTVDEGEVTGDESETHEPSTTGEALSASQAIANDVEEKEEMSEDRATEKMDMT